MCDLEHSRPLTCFSVSCAAEVRAALRFGEARADVVAGARILQVLWPVRHAEVSDAAINAVHHLYTHTQLSVIHSWDLLMHRIRVSLVPLSIMHRVQWGKKVGQKSQPPIVKTYTILILNTFLPHCTFIEM